MLSKTKGLVLSYLRYRETSILVTIYTKEFGIATYIENGVRSAKAKHKMALFQPMTLLDLEVFHKPGKGLYRISEAKCFFPYQQIPFDIAKTSIALFLSEILGKVLKEEESNPYLFEFLVDSLQFLDRTPMNFENFHIQFLWRLTSFLGITPSDSVEFLSQLNIEKFSLLSEVDKSWIDEIVNTPLGSTQAISRAQRKNLLAGVIFFYQLHIESFGELRSWQILQEVME